MLLGWNQETLSEKAGVPLSTLKRIESVDDDALPNSANAKKIETGLVEAGIIFLAKQENKGLGVRLKQ